MFKKINLNSIPIIFTAVVLLASIQLSYADGNSFTVNVPNNQGGYSAVVIQQSGSGYTGPQGEYYTQFPSVAQLQAMYGANAPAGTSVTVTIPPPALPVYVQPDPPAPDYIWTPGYWAYNSFWQDYYWVPGTWVTPRPGLLWTPGYWGWSSGAYIFNEGYWGPHVGFYGGINYGWGYGGHGFSGGSWNNGAFVNVRINFGHRGGGWNNANGGSSSSGEGWKNGASNNTSSSNVSNVTNITNNTTNNTSSFNGGPGGTQAKPTPEERVAMKEKHIPATAQQKMQVRTAMKNPALRASANHGRPAIAATARPGVFKGKGVVAAKKAGAFYNKTKPRASGGNRAAAVARHRTPTVAARHVSGVQVAKHQSHVQPKPRPKPQTKPKPKQKPKPKPKPKAPPTNGNNN